MTYLAGLSFPLPLPELFPPEPLEAAPEDFERMLASSPLRVAMTFCCLSALSAREVSPSGDSALFLEDEPVCNG